MATAAKNNKKAKTTEKKEVKQIMVFKRQNYILLIVSLLVVIIGFIVMGGSEGQAFDHPTKITIAPLIVLFGFALGVFSILYTPKAQGQTEKQP